MELFPSSRRPVTASEVLLDGERFNGVCRTFFIQSVFAGLGGLAMFLDGPCGRCAQWPSKSLTKSGVQAGARKEASTAEDGTAHSAIASRSILQTSLATFAPKLECLRQCPGDHRSKCGPCRPTRRRTTNRNIGGPVSERNRFVRFPKNPPNRGWNVVDALVGSRLPSPTRAFQPKATRFTRRTAGNRERAALQNRFARCAEQISR